jgi:probable F420-dependent oxidoreductase
VKFGITVFLTDRSIGPVELARAAEERGFASLYFPEHTHYPLASAPSPMRSSVTLPADVASDLDDAYRRTIDPFTALAAAAAVTTRLTLGTGIALVAQHDPITLAKQVATIDHLSAGRFILGVGYGWNKVEMADHGVDYRRRRDVVREHVLAMETLWADEVAEFHGEFVDLAPSYAWPKPVQRPRVPVLLGGAAGPTLFSHIAEYGDGWIPIGGAGLAAALPRLRAVMEEASRDPSTLRIVSFGTVPDPEKLSYYEEVGISEVVARVPSGPADVVLPVLDDFARYVRS